MAVQRLFLRVWNTTPSTRFLLNNRPSPTLIFQAYMKQDLNAKLKSLQIPDKPKRPLTAYFRFLQDRREQIARDNPDAKITEIIKKCAEEWKTCDPTMKQKYETEFKAEMEVFAKESAAYKAKLSDEQIEGLKEVRREIREDKEKSKKRKLNKDEHKPKKPIGAYGIFIMAKAKEMNRKDFVTLMKELKSDWTDLNEAEKSIYIEQAKKARTQYDIELAEWEKKMIAKGNLNLVRSKTLDERGTSRILGKLTVKLPKKGGKAGSSE